MHIHTQIHIQVLKYFGSNRPYPPTLLPSQAFDQPFYSAVSIPEKIQISAPVMSIQAKAPQASPRGLNPFNSACYSSGGLMTATTPDMSRQVKK